MEELHIGIIGLGLIGGSLAKTLKKVSPSCAITAFDTNKATLKLALQEGAIDREAGAIDEAFGNCDFIFLCAPVAFNSAYLYRVQQVMPKHCILTDVGSVKGDIHKMVTELGLEHNFIGGHPMAGSEKSGYQNASERLLENAFYVLTPTADVAAEKVERYQNLVSSLNALPLVLDASQHDAIVAAISHLPHIAAAGLVNLIRESDSKEGLMKLMAAGGFKDITRIASSSPVMWQQICLTNKGNIVKILEDYIQTLQSFLADILGEEKESVFSRFQAAMEYRNSFADASLGPIKKVYAIHCDIIDEAGGIATVATILATNHLSIKNIGILHNREFEDGVLRIAFYEEEAAKEAAKLLRRHHYTVYEH